MSTDTVRVWWADLARPPVPEQRLAAALTRRERARANRFRYPRHRTEWVNARGLLRHLLAELSGVAPSDIELVSGPRGKPALADGGLRFNLAHAASLAVFAVSRDCELGVDLEAVRNGAGSAGAIAERFFSASEVAWLRALPPAQRERGFVRLWVCKEAYVKATGAGIAAVELSSFAIELQSGPRLRAETATAPADLARWSLRELAAPPGFAAALATERETRVVIEAEPGRDWRLPVRLPASG